MDMDTIGHGCLAWTWTRMFGMDMDTDVWHGHGHGCLAWTWTRMFGMDMDTDVWHGPRQRKACINFANYNKITRINFITVYINFVMNDICYL